MTTLTDSQKAQISAWLREGLQLSEIQNRLVRELSVQVTYMELKLLVSDLNLVPKDKEPTAPPANLSGPAKQQTPPKTPSATATAGIGKSPGVSPGPGSAVPNAQVSVTLDALARPGAMASGSVTFSDGKRAAWYVDEMGRLSVAPAEPGYRPPPNDMQEFQAALERELTRAGL